MLKLYFIVQLRGCGSCRPGSEPPSLFVSSETNVKRNPDGWPVIAPEEGQGMTKKINSPVFIRNLQKLVRVSFSSAPGINEQRDRSQQNSTLTFKAEDWAGCPVARLNDCVTLFSRTRRMSPSADSTKISVLSKNAGLTGKHHHAPSDNQLQKTRTPPELNCNINTIANNWV